MSLIFLFLFSFLFLPFSAPFNLVVTFVVWLFFSSFFAFPTNSFQLVTGKTPDEDGRVSYASVRELALVELFTNKSKGIDSAPASPQASHARLLQVPSTSSPTYLSRPSGQTSLGLQDFVGQGSHRSHRAQPSPVISSTGPSLSKPLTLGEAGLWGLPDPVDQLLSSHLSNQKSKIDAFGQQQQQQQQQPPSQGYHHSPTSGSKYATAQNLLGNPNDSAWSARAVGMAELSSLQRPSFGSSGGGTSSGIPGGSGNGNASGGGSSFQLPFSQQRSSLTFDPAEISPESFTPSSTTSSTTPHHRSHRQGSHHRQSSSSSSSHAPPMISVNGSMQPLPQQSTSTVGGGGFNSASDVGIHSYPNDPKLGLASLGENDFLSCVRFFFFFSFLDLVWICREAGLSTLPLPIALFGGMGVGGWGVDSLPHSVDPL